MGKVTLTKTKNNQIFSIPMEPIQFNQTGNEIGNEIEDSLISKQETFKKQMQWTNIYRLLSCNPTSLIEKNLLN